MRIAFDLDGTLIDSIAHIHEAVLQGLDDLSLGTLDRPTMQRFVGKGLPHAMTQVLDHLNHPQSLHERLCEVVLTHYTNTPSDPESVFEGVHPALKALRRQGHALSICTNKPYQAALNALRDTHLLAYFDLVIGGDSLPSRKPDPAMLLACAPDLYVGDSEVDADTATAAGVPFLLFTEGYRKSPVTQIAHRDHFDHYDTLPTLV